MNSCYMCQNRSLGCHMTCDSYRAFRAAIDKKKDDKRQYYRNNLVPKHRECRIRKIFEV